MPRFHQSKRSYALEKRLSNPMFKRAPEHTAIPLKRKGGNAAYDQDFGGAEQRFRAAPGCVPGGTFVKFAYLERDEGQFLIKLSVFRRRGAGSVFLIGQLVAQVFEPCEWPRVFVGHDYKAPGRDEYAWETTIGEEKASNKHVGQGRGEDEFVAMRNKRDSELAMPRLIVPSLQVNMRAGQMPPADDDGNVYLRVPVNKL